MSGILNAFVGGSYGAVPGAPTIGTATATSYSTATVAFTAGSTGGLPITGYQATCTATGTHTATGTTSPITITGLSGGTSYTFKVRAQNALGYGAYSGNSNSITTPVQPSSTTYTALGSPQALYSWVAPTGVTSVSVVAVGQAGGSPNTGGAGLGWKNNISVTPGNSYQVGFCYNCGGAWFISKSTVSGQSPSAGGGAYGGYVGTGGGNGGPAYYSSGGAGGYSGAGGHGSTTQTGVGGAGSGGGGGGGGSHAYYCCPPICNIVAGAGGGVGLYGQGTSGAGGSCAGFGGGGYGGSGGGNGANGTCNPGNSPAKGGCYGGGRGGFSAQVVACFTQVNPGAVRIVWPGSSRQFPSTCVGSP